MSATNQLLLLYKPKLIVLSLQVLLDASEFNDDKAIIDYKLIQSIGASPMRINELTMTVYWVTKEMEIIYRDDLDLFKANVMFKKITTYYIEFYKYVHSLYYRIQANIYKDNDEAGLKLNLLKNEHEFGNVNIHFEKEKPHAEIKMGLEDRGMDVFVGLKESNLIFFSVKSKSNTIPENVDDILATIELSSDGRVLKTELDWRPESFEELHEALLDTQINIVENRLLLGINSLVRAFGNATLMIMDDTFDEIIDTLDIDPRKYSDIVREWRENIATLYIYKIAIVQQIVDYSTDVVVYVFDET